MMAWTYNSPSSRRNAGGVLNLGASSELTIASGEITVTRSFHTIDTASDGASDDLDTINGLTAGGLYLLMAEHTDRTVVVKHGTGNILVAGAADYSMSSTNEACFVFSPDGSNAIVISAPTVT